LLWLIDAACIRGVMVCCAVLKVREEAFARRPDPSHSEARPERTPGLSKHNSMKPRDAPKDELAAQVRSTFLGAAPLLAPRGMRDGKQGGHP
jgi:hypothetical protein